MPIASYKDAEEKQSYFEESGNGPRSIGKILARVYGYMAIGLLITAAVSLLVAWIFSSRINSVASLDEKNAWTIGYMATVISCGVVILIMTFALPIGLARNKHSIWPYYIIYAIAMGGLLSAFLLAGISWYTIGEAFGITAAGFLVMFLIGWFSKANITFAGYVVTMILSMALLFGAVWGLVWLINGMTWQQYYTWNLIMSGIIVVITLIVIAIDSYNIKKTLERGENSSNIVLYCAFCMYSDFIALLIRVLYILAISQKNS